MASTKRARIACVLIPRLAVAMERRAKPTLTGPVVIGGYPYERKPVYDCSEEAAARGVEVGMSVRVAHDLCPEAIFLPADEEKYTRSFQEMVDVLGSFSPNVDVGGQGSGDRTLIPDPRPPARQCFLDVHGLRLLHGDDAQLARKMSAAVRRKTELTPVVGVGGVMFVAQVAALRAGPGEPIVVPPGQEKAFLSSLPTSFLPCSSWMLEHLARLGIQNIGELAALPANTMMRQFGPEGVIAHRLANGIDERVVQSSPEPEVLTASRDLDDGLGVGCWVLGVGGQGIGGGEKGKRGKGERTPPHPFSPPPSDPRPLQELLSELQARGQMCQQVVLTLVREDGTVEEARVMLHEPTSREDELARALERLWQRLGVGGRGSGVGSRGSRGGPPRPPTPISAVRITLGDLCRERGKVVRLFREGADDSQVARIVGHVQSKLGPGRLKRAVPLDVNSRLPERRFALVSRG